VPKPSVLPVEFAGERVIHPQEQREVRPAQLCRQCLHNLEVRKQLGELEHIEQVSPAEPGPELYGQFSGPCPDNFLAVTSALFIQHFAAHTFTFEELGVDRLFVDEAQAFKNLFYISKMTRVAGLPQTASERAFDMFLKVQHVQKQNGGGGVVFATGTPVTNTMAEMFTMQRYLQMDSLRRLRLQHFDAWAGTFGETVTAMEL
jgi:hypothetical protein